MRISDWSSDVCSSDLNYNFTFAQDAANAAALTITPRALTVTADALDRIYGDANPALTYAVGGLGLVNGDTLTGALATVFHPSAGRSEEHTSELQSLMRISYAVFCLKKKKQRYKYQTHKHKESYHGTSYEH